MKTSMDYINDLKEKGLIMSSREEMLFSNGFKLGMTEAMNITTTAINIALDECNIADGTITDEDNEED